MRRLALCLTFVLFAAACTTVVPPSPSPSSAPVAPNNLANFNSATLGAVGSAIAVLMKASPIDTLVGGTLGVAVGDAISGYFKQPNTLTGTLFVPVQPQAMKIVMGDQVTGPSAAVCPQGFVFRPAGQGFTCTPQESSSTTTTTSTTVNTPR
jgi:hypothetical protein